MSGAYSMNAADLTNIGAGFSEPALGSQSVFRAALQALSHPGRPVDVPHDAEVPLQGHAASAALLLALLDPDCRLWLSPSLAAGGAAAWLRFHCGCELVSDPAKAQFAWVAANDELPSLDQFAQGSDASPDHAATCVLDVPALAVGNGPTAWKLQGPGILDPRWLQVDGLQPHVAEGLLAHRASNHAAFPRGVDLFLATQHQIVGLPRTTRIQREA